MIYLEIYVASSANFLLCSRYFMLLIVSYKSFSLHLHYLLTELVDFARLLEYPQSAVAEAS